MRITVSVLLVAAALLFIVSNRDPVQIAFFGLYFDLPMWIWIIVFLAIGTVIGWLRPWRKSTK